MSTQSEAHHDATRAADQPDDRLTVAQWHDLVLRCTSAAWRTTGYSSTHVAVYALVDAALQEAMPHAYPETLP